MERHRRPIVRDPENERGRRKEQREKETGREEEAGQRRGGGGSQSRWDGGWCQGGRQSRCLPAAVNSQDRCCRQACGQVPALLHQCGAPWVQAARGVKGRGSAEGQAGLSQSPPPRLCDLGPQCSHLGNGPQDPAGSVGYVPCIQPRSCEGAALQASSVPAQPPGSMWEVWPRHLGTSNPGVWFPLQKVGRRLPTPIHPGPLHYPGSNLVIF